MSYDRNYMNRCIRQTKSLTLSRQKLELPKAEDISDHSAKFALRVLDKTHTSKHTDPETIQILQDEINQLIKSSPTDHKTCASLLRRCCSRTAFAQGRQLHEYVSTHYQHTSHALYFNNLLVRMYGNCGRVEEAHKVFETLQEKNSHSWNILISAYAQNGHLRSALDLYWVMDTSLRCNITYTIALGICSKLGTISEGREIHKSISGTSSETFGGRNSVGISLVNMYGKCASPEEARAVFDKLTHKSVICWNSMLSAYAQNQRDRETIQLHRLMDLEGVKPTGCTLTSIIDACSSNKFLARQVHARATEAGLVSDIITASALVNMYGKCGLLEEARRLFDSIERKNCFTWSGMIAGYAGNGKSKQALELFKKMDVKPNSVTFISVLDACSQIGDSETGKTVHNMFVPDGSYSDVTFGNALLNMYGKCGLWEDAKGVFDGMPRKSVISWTSMISAYSRGGMSDEALELYKKMEFKPNTVTVISILEACAEGGALKEGRKIHQKLVHDKSIKPDGIVGNAIVNMYGKCGSISEAWEVFSKMKEKTVVSWTSILAASAEQGDGSEAFVIHRHMCSEGIVPDDVTFISLLFACSHGGTLERGREVFMHMVSDFYAVPVLEHYRCMVDLLGRSGKLSDAEELIRTMPYEEDTVAWSTLLSGCKLHNNEVYGRVAADKLVEMSPGDSSGYVLLAHIYASKGMVADAQMIFKLSEEIAQRAQVMCSLPT